MDPFPLLIFLDYPWRFPSSSTDSNVIKWLYFPDFHTKPNPLFLLCEYSLYLLSVCHWDCCYWDWDWVWD